jgi:hypothetical protein
MTPRRPLLLLVAGAALLAAVPAAALVSPGRTITAPGPAARIGLTGRTVVVAVRRAGTQCEQIRMWNTASRGTWAFPEQPGCREATSGGHGVDAVAVSGRRVLWVDYACGNLCDWTLRTASTTLRRPRLLRDVLAGSEAGEPGPIVLGQGTPSGVPYAVNGDAGAEVVYLGGNGAAVFRTTLPRPVRALAAGNGPGGRRVAALLDDGSITTLGSSGTPVDTTAAVSGTVGALALAPAGAVVQVGDEVRVQVGATVKAATTLPAGARMLSYAEGRVLYVSAGFVRARRVTTGADVPLLRLAPTAPAGPTLAALSTNGLAWARGRTVAWKAAVLAGLP